MPTDSQKAAGLSAPSRFGTLNRALHVGVISVAIMLMLSACSDDRPASHGENQAGKPGQGIMLQSAAGRAQQPLSPQYVAPAPPPQPPAAAPAKANPWAVQTQPREYRQYRSRQWGQAQPPQPQYVQPPSGPQYRPLEPQTSAPTRRAPVIEQPRQGYRPVAPYDRLSGSSFGTPGYYSPYGGASAGYYQPWVYIAPGPMYAPQWPGYW